MKVRVLYIAGKMTGEPDLNYPAFDDAAARLRSMGYTVRNPAENSPPKCGTWLGWMRKAIKQVAASDAVVLLPGWQRSKGARTEQRLARDLGLPRWTLAQVLRGEVKP
jgi:hypothetical protein